jgi:ectoine hydroxylase-related dioxygenase (phytanoyl-CoA dioxygenase family)
LVYVGSLFHGGGANQSDVQRRGAVFSYNLGWLRQTENFYLSVPWGTAQHFDEPLLRLMGYQIQRPNVGWVEGIDPLRWIRMGRPAICSAEDALTPSQIEDTKLIAQNPDVFAAYLT